MEVYTLKYDLGCSLLDVEPQDSAWGESVLLFLHCSYVSIL